MKRNAGTSMAHGYNNCDGGGDWTRARYQLGSEDVNCTTRKLENGIHVPVFSRCSCDDKDDVFQSCHNFTSQNEARPQNPASPCFPAESPQLLRRPKFMTSLEILREYYTCPICYDTCIETTATNCGHKFCRDCIDEWKKKKPICPICSTLITSQHRLFHDDQLIESHLDALPEHVRGRFENARRCRMETFLKNQNSRSMLNRVRRKLDNSLTYLRCKNPASIRNRISSSTHHIFGNLRNFDRKTVTIFAALIVVLLIIFGKYLFEESPFFRYVWLAVKNYNGTVPYHWLKGDDTMALIEKIGERESGNENHSESSIYKLYNWLNSMFGVVGNLAPVGI